MSDYQVINYLKIALSQPSNSLTECFYFDKNQQVLFSIHVADYFMLNENLEIDSSVQSSYSKDDQEKLVKWIKRLDKNDKSILRVPQKGITDDKLQEIEALQFIHNHNIDLNRAKVWQEELGSSINTVNIDLVENTDKKTSKKWWQF